MMKTPPKKKPPRVEQVGGAKWKGTEQQTRAKKGTVMKKLVKQVHYQQKKKRKGRDQETPKGGFKCKSHKWSTKVLCAGVNKRSQMFPQRREERIGGKTIKKGNEKKARRRNNNQHKHASETGRVSNKQEKKTASSRAKHKQQRASEG